MKPIRILSALAGAAALLGSAHAQSEPGDLIAVASHTSNLKTFVAAVKAADLAEALQAKGPLTVFAPTDEAFAKLPKETLEDLLKPENKEKLVAILTYHIAPGKYQAADAQTAELATLNGKKLDNRVIDGSASVNKAKVVKSDIPASNGVIHLLDEVVLP